MIVLIAGENKIFLYFISTLLKWQSANLLANHLTNFDLSGIIEMYKSFPKILDFIGGEWLLLKFSNS